MSAHPRTKFVRQAVVPPEQMSKKELIKTVVALREANGELHSQMAGFRYALGKAQQKIKGYRLANETRKLVAQAAERSGRPPVTQRPWELGPTTDEVVERDTLLRPVLASRHTQSESNLKLDIDDGSEVISSAPMFKSPSTAVLLQREKARAAASFGGGAPRVPRQKTKKEKKAGMNFGGLLIDMEPLAPSKLKSLLKEDEKNRKRGKSPIKKRPQSASNAHQNRTAKMNGAYHMSEEQAAVHMATMDMPFAKLTMDPRLHADREKAMSKRKSKRDGVQSWSRPEHSDVTSMFMVKR
eukprot:Stramenopile-MAST_4_protein_3012